MEAVLFVGLQGAGKSTFYAARFLQTHLRISLDLLKTRHREARFLALRLESGMRFVVDNTNPTAANRARYLVPARTAGFRTAGYFFDVDFDGCLERNARRTGRQQVPRHAIAATAEKLEPPRFEEGFDALFRVTAGEGGFRVKEVQDEVRRPRPEDAGL